jgi:nitrite reductase/ring-hydroxylating ferredoxin subunit
MKQAGHNSEGPGVDDQHEQRGDIMERRSFLKRSIKGLYLAIGALLGVSGVAVWLELRGRKPHKHWFQTVARLGELEIGKPREVNVYEGPPVEQDKPIGQAWLIRRDQNTVEAYSARCPHQGGKIGFDGQQFLCRRHGAAFDLACQRITPKAGEKPNPAPRDMDPLDVQLTPDDASKEMLIQVDYQAFVPGRPARILEEQNG